MCLGASLVQPAAICSGDLQRRFAAAMNSSRLSMLRHSPYGKKFYQCVDHVLAVNAATDRHRQTLSRSIHPRSKLNNLREAMHSSWPL
jgi:hypothetical protein